MTLLEIAIIESKRRIQLNPSLETFLAEVEARFVVMPITGRICAQAIAPCPPAILKTPPTGSSVRLRWSTDFPHHCRPQYPPLKSNPNDLVKMASLDRRRQRFAPDLPGYNTSFYGARSKGPAPPDVQISGLPRFLRNLRGGNC